MDQPTATVAPNRRFSPVWIIPIVSVLVAGWMVYQYLSQQGPEIHLASPTASGVVPDKTQVKVRSVKVGMVTAVKLSKDYSQIDLTVRMDSGTERMLGKDSEFWLVKPRIGTEGVTGLETLLSGPYIELEPGDSKERRSDFVMLSAPPVAGPNIRGTRIILVASEAGKLAIGDPVMFEGYVVGRVEKTGFDVARLRPPISCLFSKPTAACCGPAVGFGSTRVLILISAHGGSISMLPPWKR